MLAVAALALGACSSRPPGPSVFVDPEPYKYADDELRLTFSAEGGSEAAGELKLTHKATKAQQALPIAVSRGKPFVVKLTADVLPALGTATSGIERYGLEVSVMIPGGYWQGLWWASPKTDGYATEFAVITDLEARPPVFPRVPVLPGGQPGPPPGLPGMATDPWVQVEEQAPMEDAALQAAAERGGRDLAVTGRLATADERRASRVPGVPGLAVEVYWFEVRGTFPKQVVVGTLSGSEDARILTPAGFTMLVPRIARPMPLDVEPMET